MQRNRFYAVNSLVRSVELHVHENFVDEEGGDQLRPSTMRLETH